MYHLTCSYHLMVADALLIDVRWFFAMPHMWDYWDVHKWHKGPESLKGFHWKSIVWSFPIHLHKSLTVAYPLNLGSCSGIAQCLIQLMLATIVQCTSLTRLSTFRFQVASSKSPKNGVKTIFNMEHFISYLAWISPIILVKFNVIYSLNCRMILFYTSHCYWVEKT